MKKILRAKTGTYTDRQTGQEKTSYATIGRVIVTKTGNEMIKIDSIPVNWDGWAYINDDDRMDKVRDAAAPSRPVRDDFDDPVPF